MADVLLNDFKRLWAETSAPVLDAVARVGESGWYVLGREVDAFERALAPRMARGEAIGCASGLDAIEIALRAARVPAGAKVLTTPLSAFATTLAIVRAGAVPVFVDVDRHGLLDLRACREALASDPALRVMVPVHLYGHTLDLAELHDLRERFGVWIVEDCAQSIGARFRGRPAGSVGQLAAISFYPTKNLGALGDGGAVLVDDPALAARCRVLRDYGQRAKYEHAELGLNSRLDELHAAILHRAFLPSLERWTARRAEIAQAYARGLAHPAIRRLEPPEGSASAWHLFPIQVPPGARDRFMEHMRREGIQTGVHYPTVIPAQRALSGAKFEVWGDCAVAREIAAAEVSLPIHPYLTDEEIHRVVDAVNSWAAP